MIYRIQGVEVAQGLIATTIPWGHATRVVGASAPLQGPVLEHQRIANSSGAVDR